MSTPSVALSGLARTNLREQALSALRRAISSGELEPGTHLAEVDLSERLGISRGTLREALRQLQQEGIVSAGPRGRLSVRTLDAKEITDLFSVRAELESLACATLCAHADRRPVVAVLRESLRAMDRAAKANLEERIESDLAFHILLCRLTENATLLHSWRTLEGAIRMSFMWAGEERAVGNMRVDRHAAIVDAIELGDARSARAVVLEHMERAAANLVR